LPGPRRKAEVGEELGLSGSPSVLSSSWISWMKVMVGFITNGFMAVKLSSASKIRTASKMRKWVVSASPSQPSASVARRSLGG